MAEGEANGRRSALGRILVRGAVCVVVGAVSNLVIACACGVWGSTTVGAFLNVARPAMIAQAIPSTWPPEGDSNAGRTYYGVHARAGFATDAWLIGLSQPPQSFGWGAIDRDVVVVTSGWPCRTLKCRTVRSGAAGPTFAPARETDRWEWDNAIAVPAWFGPSRVIAANNSFDRLVPEGLPRVLPTGVLWRGVVLGTLFYAAAITGITLAARWLRRVWRRAVRVGEEGRVVSKVPGLALLLALGGALNVVVAVGCALWSPAGARYVVYGGSDDRMRRLALDQEYDAYGRAPGPGIDVFDVERIEGRQPLTGEHLLIVASGWPVMSMESRAHWKTLSSSAYADATIRNGAAAPRWLYPAKMQGYSVGNAWPAYSTRLIPLGVRWPGMIAGAVFWAFVVLAARDAWRGVLTMRRRKRGGCLACGYAIGAMATCPECGAASAQGGS